MVRTRQRIVGVWFACVLLVSSCTTLQNNAKYELSDGSYKLKMDGKKRDTYVENNSDSIVIYLFPEKKSIALPAQLETYTPTSQTFIKPSVDIDILTALFKVRGERKNSVPPQLNANFNGNIYLGYRSDIYRIHYTKNPLAIYKRRINHFGFSGGLFLGLGNTAMTPTTTNNAISIEYDGIVLQKGIAGIVAINKLTLGLSLGFDNLIDSHSTVWVYNNKPWFGLMLGLNLN